MDEGIWIALNIEKIRIVCQTLLKMGKSPHNLKFSSMHKWQVTIRINP
jgi:hypothetical protein